ncbi:hypothetical protein FKM82_012548 [Ascaphus truei]
MSVLKSTGFIPYKVSGDAAKNNISHMPAYRYSSNVSGPLAPSSGSKNMMHRYLNSSITTAWSNVDQSGKITLNSSPKTILTMPYSYAKFAKLLVFPHIP